MNAANIVNSAAAGNPITLQALDVNGNAVTPTANCVSQADGFTLRTPAGLAIGGNVISGLGSNGAPASAGEASSIAFGNLAATDATAAGAIAIGSGAGVAAGATGSIALGAGAQATGANSVALGAGSVAGRGPLTGYAALGLTGPQTSAGEVSVGSAGAPRQITNVAAGIDPTDAVNAAQLAGVAAQIGTLSSGAVLYDSASRDRVTLAGATGTTIGNVAPGALNAASTEAVNGSQLFATNANVANLTTIVQNGSASPVRYSDPAAPAVPNGGVATNDVALVGAAAGPVGLHNVRDGAIGAGSTDAVTGSQMATLGTGVAAALGGGTTYDPAANAVTTSLAYSGAQYGSVQAALSAVESQVAAGSNDSAVIYDGADRGTVTLAGVGGTTLTNVRAGALTPDSTDAVNGSQLAATNASIANGAVGPVQYSSPANSNVPNGGVRTNDVALVGAAPGTVVLHNVGDGSILPGSTDAVNGGQVYALGQNAVNAVTYATDAAGARTNTVALAGGDPAAPVTVTNVAPATLAAGSTDAVNGGQLFTTNQAVAAVQATASTALTLGQGAVQYDGASRTSITLGNSGGATTAAAPVTIRNVAAGTAGTDAVNVAQLNSGLGSTLSQANAYTNQQLSAVNFNLRGIRRDANAGTAGALAAAGLPQAYEAGKGMVALAAGTFRGQSAFAFGLSKAMDDGHAVVKVAATYDTRGAAGASAGMGWQF